MDVKRLVRVSSPSMRLAALVLCGVVAVFEGPAMASPPAEAPQSGSVADAPAAGSVAAEAAAAQAVPVIDGSVLDDKAWATAKVITGFWQTTPDEGQPASENTEVRVLYTETALYIGVVNYDRCARAHHQLRKPPRRLAHQHRQLSRHPRYLSRSAEWLCVRHQPGWYRVRRTGDRRRTRRGRRWWGRWWWWRRRRWRRRWRWWWRWRWTGRRLGRRVQHQLGWVLAGRIADVRRRLERGVCHSVPHASLSGARRAGVGHQLSAQHPPAQRDRVLGAASAAIRSEPRVAGRHVVGPRDSGAAQPAVDAVSPGNEQTGRQLFGRGARKKTGSSAWT